MSDSLQPHGQRSLVGYSPWDFPGKNTRLGSHSLLQGIFPAQGLNRHLLLGRQILYCRATWEAPGPVLIPLGSLKCELLVAMRPLGDLSGSRYFRKRGHVSPLHRNPLFSKEALSIIEAKQGSMVGLFCLRVKFEIL